jgi:hypothetical protein
MIAHLKLPFEFNIEKLRHDLETVLQHHWTPHFNTGGYEGSWSAIPLYAPGGNPSNIIAHYLGEDEIKATPLLENCEYFREVIDQFKCSVITARLMKLAAEAYIKPHKDYDSGYEDGMFRIHIPVITNSQVEFLLDGERVVMNPGECWYTNVNFEHSVANKGEEDRVHLVLDFTRNDWSDQLFFNLAPREEFFPQEEEEYSAEVLLKMIDSLEMMNDSKYDYHIQKLKQRLKEI